MIGFDLARALTVLDRDMRRHLGKGLAVTGPLIDPHVIDRALGRRAGPRTLEETCARYRVRHQAGRGPGEDALSAARLAWRPAWVHPAAVGRLTPAERHRQQVDWAEQRATGLTRACGRGSSHNIISCIRDQVSYLPSDALRARIDRHWWERRVTALRPAVGIGPGTLNGRLAFPISPTFKRAA
ncbi:hypothetical protein [Streptomyces sp. NPDC017941]|uniref:hypothetical protein n=1 Tax=Streptomyces sp. NPDC017941 TaxID=3365018 RepID=UPI0037A8CE15